MQIAMKTDNAIIKVK